MLSVSRHNLRILTVAAALLLLCAPSVFAQTLGSIQGFITDDSGAALPGVSVTATNAETGANRVVASNAQGYYDVRSIPAGIYNVVAALDGFQTVRQESLRLQVGQTVDVNFKLGVAAVEEVITVTSSSPLVEVSRSSAASYVSQEEIEALPISGRDFTDFAFLAPTVQRDTSRGFITMSGQRGIYTGLNIDGSSGKSAFFGYGRGGEATENDGLVVAQDSVREFQVITNGFAPEYGANGGGYLNVITKSGTNNFQGSAFYFFRDDSFVEDIPSSPLDDFNGRDGSRPVSEFERTNYGLSLGGPISQDRTHFFFSYDQTQRDEPFTRSLDTPGLYDAILQRAQGEPAFARLVEDYTPNADGTADGLFLRAVDNLILFGKVDHQFSDANTGSFRINFTDYERASDFQDEESLKLEDTLSLVASMVTVVGSKGINEARLQFATDNLDRLSVRVGQPIEAELEFRFGEFDEVGKLDFLPIFVEEEKLQFQNQYSYLFNDHDLKFGVDYQEDNLAQLFAGSRDGRYRFSSIDDFLNNNASELRVFFGDVEFPNYDEKQSLLGVFAQDSWRPNEKLTVNYGFRYGATYNPGGLLHVFPEGENIPDDTNNFAPRLGFAYALGDSARDVIRGGLGLFYGRTPSLLFASQVQEPGVFPFFGRITVRPGQTGFVPLGTSIDNQNPPMDIIPSPALVNPDFEDSETWRLNLGYERELGGNWSTGVDVVYAEGDKLQTNVDTNRTLTGYDDFGRPLYSGDDRPDSNFGEIFTRQSIGESEYTAITLKVNRRYADRYQLQAHYTWAEDKDSDSNERTATTVTISDITNPRYDFGLSERDVESRFVLSGLVVLPFDIKLSGIVEYRSGTPFTALDPGRDVQDYPGFFGDGPDARAIINGQLVGRNTFRNESISRVDLRVAKLFEVGNYQFDVFGEVFNLFDENSFGVERGQQNPGETDFGIGDDLLTDQRQFQIGARVSFK